MNYIKQINAFYIKHEIEPLSGLAISLWHGIMQINNRTGWLPQFTAPVAILRLKSGLSEGTFKRALDRNKNTWM